MTRLAAYGFPYGTEDGYPKITREMTPEQYETHKLRLAEISQAMMEAEHIIRENSSIDIEKLEFVYQNSDEYKGIIYPVKGEPWRTVATSGEFQLVTYMVLRYFGVETSVEDLVRIANWGEWQHKNGTWHHYIDTVCEAYGVSTVRVSSLQQIGWIMSDMGGLGIALLDNDMFPGAKGNVLVVITKIWDGKVYYYYPGSAKGKISHNKLKTFYKHLKVLWGAAVDYGKYCEGNET